MLVPQSLAYAELAGMPPERGLYAAALPLIVAAPLACSPYLQTGPVAVTCLLTFGALSGMASPAATSTSRSGWRSRSWSGVVRLAIGLLRAGVIAYLMSQPMLIGFIPAAAILIVARSYRPRSAPTPPDGDLLLSRPRGVSCIPGRGSSPPRSWRSPCSAPSSAGGGCTACFRAC